MLLSELPLPFHIPFLIVNFSLAARCAILASLPFVGVIFLLPYICPLHDLGLCQVHAQSLPLGVGQAHNGVFVPLFLGNAGGTQPEYP